ncbi:MAG: glycosyltransferase family 2 protein [Bacteroidota bacterium]|nr:glycosyltransferase family 2 protein [Bacteroidota bacterium]
MNDNINISVSVIIPTRGRVEFLKRAIESVIMQHVDGMEICIADNNTHAELNMAVRELFGQYEKENPAIKWTFLMSEKANAAGVRNEAMQRVKGSYILFLDDDDEFLEGSVAIRLHEIKKNPDVALLYCAAYSKIYPYPFKMYWYYEYQPWLHLDRIETMSCSCMIINREIILSVGLSFDEDLIRRHDYDFCRRLLAMHLKVMSISKPLVIVNSHRHERISTVPVDIKAARQNLVNKWGPGMEQDIYDYAQGVVLWRKCFGLENENYNQLCAELQADFNRPLSFNYKARLRLVCVSPLAYLTLYHVGVSLYQVYRNRMVPLLNR